MLKDSAFLHEGGSFQVKDAVGGNKGGKGSPMLISHGIPPATILPSNKLPEGLAHVLTESDILEGDLDELKSLNPVLENTSNILGANISFLDQLPGKYQSSGADQQIPEDQESSIAQEYHEDKKPHSPYSESTNGQKSSIPNLRKYVESPPNDVNWFISEQSEGGGKGVANRDTSFEKEVVSCRQKFLADSISEQILNELIAEVKAEPLFFNQTAKLQTPSLLGDGKVTLNLLEDPRYISESSEEETVYGIRTNMNAVFEYCNLLVRFISDHYLDLLLEKYNTKIGQKPDKMLQDIRNREIGLINSMTPWTTQLSLAQKTAGSTSKAEDTFLPEFIFNRLEEEIIVIFGLTTEQL